MAGIVVGLGLAGLLIGVALRSASPDYDVLEEHLPVIRESHRWLAAAPLVSATDRAAVAEVVLGAELIPNQDDVYAPSVEMQQSLAALISRWISLRADADADAYIDWMRSRGYSWALTHPEGRKHYNMKDAGVRNAWKVYTGIDAPERVEDIDPEEFFRACFLRSLEMKHGILHPHRVSSRAEALYQSIPITKADTRPGSMNPYPGIERWSESATSGDRPHWVAPVVYADILRRDSVAFVAIVSIGTQSHDGFWVPTTIAAYYDIATGEWHLQSVTYSNSLYDGIAIER